MKRGVFCQALTNKSAIVVLLLQNYLCELQDKRGFTILHSCIEKDEFQCAEKVFSQAQAKLNKMITATSTEGLDALLFAIKLKKINFIELLCQKISPKKYLTKKRYKVLIEALNKMNVEESKKIINIFNENAFATNTHHWNISNEEGIIEENVIDQLTFWANIRNESHQPN